MTYALLPLSLIFSLWLGLSTRARAEVQTSINMTIPSLTIGNSGAFSSSQASGPVGTNAGTATHNFAGVVGFTQSSGTGRFSSLNGVTRYGIAFDGFQMLRSFISPNYLTAVSSNTACPANGTYQWLMVRLRTPDTPRDPMNLTATSLSIGGTMSYVAGTSTFTGSNYFNLAGPTLNSSVTYGITGHSGATCASGKNLADRTGTSSLDRNFYNFYGNRSVLMVGSHGDPQVLLAVPQQSLSGAAMSPLRNYVFTGLYTYADNATTQTQSNIYLYPDASGTTFTLRSASSLTDPFSYAPLGTLTCTSLNSPTTGFCSGTISLSGVAGTGKAVCLVSPNATENLIACLAQHPQKPSNPISIIGKTVDQGLLQVSFSPAYATLAAAGSTTVTVTVRNVSSRYASSIGNPTNPLHVLGAPWSNTNAFGGGNGTCGTTLAAYASCTFNVTYLTGGYRADGTVVRVMYNNGVGTPYATGNLVGTTGLTGIAITPDTNYEGNGSTQQLTATATFTDGSTQDVSSISTWLSSNESAVTVSSTGLASWAGLGSSTVTATLGAASDTATYTVVTPPVLTATSDSVFPSTFITQGSNLSLDFNNISGGSPGNDTNMTYSCAFDKFIDGAVATGTNCTALPGSFSLNASTGALSWTPDVTAFGAYEIKVTGSLYGNVPATRIFIVDVRPRYVTSNLRGAYDANFANLTRPHYSPNIVWEDLTTNNFDGGSNSSANATWVGAGTTASPYSLSLNGSANVNFGSSLMASQTRMMFSLWMMPTSATSTDTMILTNNNDGAGNGFTLRQSTSSGKLEFSVGTETTYVSEVTSLTPRQYYRFNETSGTTLTDIGASGYNLTLAGTGTTLATTGAINGDSSTAIRFNGSGQACRTSGATSLTGTFSVEAWVRPTVSTAIGILGSRAPSDNSFEMYYQSGAFRTQIGTGAAWITTTPATSATFTTLSVWYHVVYVITPTTWRIYVNGVSAANGTYASSTPVLFNNTHNLCVGASGNAVRRYTGDIDDVSIYNTALTQLQVEAHFNRGRNYVTTIMSDTPLAYWRLGETSGTALADTTATGYQLTLGGSGQSYNQAGAIANDTNGSLGFSGAAYACRTSAATSLTGTFSVEAWVYPTNGTAFWSIVGSRRPSDSSFDFKYQAGMFHGDIGNGSAWLSTVADTAVSYTTLNTWYHVVYVVTTTGYTIYVNGSSAGSGTWGANTPVLFDNTHDLCVGAAGSNFENFTGRIDEVAIYNYGLTAAQVLKHYTAASAAGASSCPTTSNFSNNNWYNVAGMFDGTNARLFVNGRQECTMSVSGALTAPTTNLYAGATAAGTKTWQGSLAQLLMYGTTGSAVGTSTDIHTNWWSTADNFRSTPINDVVTDNLALHLDAANATRGIAFPGVGIGQTSWFDLSASLLTGTLSNFTGGAGSRWSGTGAAATPYSLDLNGTNNYVTVPYLQNGVTAYSVEVWVKTTDAGAQKTLVHNRGSGLGRSLTLGIGVTGGGHGGAGRVGWEIDSDAIDIGVSSNAAINDGNWHHVVGTWAAGAGVAVAASQFLVYIDGQLATTSAGTTGAINSPLTGLGDTLIGYHAPWNTYFNGSLAKVAIYTKQLSLAEVRQNCFASLARFSGATCN